MVAIVVVTHSEELAKGICELARQMAGGQDVLVLPAGGTDTGGLGTSIAKVQAALHETLSADGVVVLADLGSAVMVAQMALEELPPEDRARVRIADAPLVEGAIAAVVEAAGGGDLDAVQRAAERAAVIEKIPRESVEQAPVEASEAPTAAVELVITNPSGLHARPAAQFVRTAMRFRSQITVQNITHNRPPANAKSMMEVANRGTAWPGERIRIVARGEDATEAIAALRALVESGFGEQTQPIPPSTVEVRPTESVSLASNRLQGIPASEGIAIGPAFIYRPPQIQIERRTVKQPANEVSRLRQALKQAREDLTRLEREVARRDRDVARIFEFQRMMLEDETLVGAMEEYIQAERCNAEVAVSEVIADWVARFERMENVVMRQRAADVRDVGNRVLRLLLGIEEPPALASLPEPVIVIARELTPSDTARLDRERVLGFCTVGGGATSHAAILARMWGIPAVVGLGERLLQIDPGTLLALDGERGILEIEPSPEVVERYRARAEQREAIRLEAQKHSKEGAVTRDGKRIEVVANVGDVASAKEALTYGAEGIGLLRTEFLYLNRDTLPDEDEQIETYRAIFDVMGQRPVIVRTLDVGADKPLPAIDRPREENPALGVRAVRLAREQPDLLRTQLRAIMRAAVGHRVSIMFPLVTTLEEIRWLKAELGSVREELEREKIEYAREIGVGIMVETPAAALMADVLAREVDFFSIGTNDLTQYTLACDRGHPGLGYLYRSLDPAVLRLIARTVEAAHAAGKWVGVCGEMAGHLRAIPVLVGLGVDELSMTAQAIPEAKALIRRLDAEQARSLALDLLSEPDVEHCEAKVDAFLADMQST